MKTQYDFIFYFFVFERFGRMHENKTFYFIFFVWMKTRYLKPDLYLYNIKIHTNIDQNAVKYLRKITNFEKNFSMSFFYFWPGPNPAHVAGLDPATHARTLAQASHPNKPCTRETLRVHGRVRR